MLKFIALFSSLPVAIIVILMVVSASVTEKDSAQSPVCSCVGSGLIQVFYYSRWTVVFQKRLDVLETILITLTKGKEESVLTLML